MAQNVDGERNTTQRMVADNNHSDEMKACLRKAAEIRQSLEGRHHTDSTELIAEDRKR
jgi:hypothetical protein